MEENNYYPFGLKHKGYNDNGMSPLGNDVAQKWKFGGKELSEVLGLETYDFGARNYDPALARWMNLDPLAEEFSDTSPYLFTNNNPIRFVDPLGLSPEDIILRGEQNNMNKLVETINSNLGGEFISIGEDGKLGLSISDEQRGNLNEGQSALLGVLEEGINANGNVIIGVDNGSEKILFGSFSDETIDIADINAIGDGEGLNEASIIGHEFKEQFEKQINGKKRPEAHKTAENAEKLITGFDRLPDSELRNKRIDRVTQRRRVGTETYTTVSGSKDFNFQKGNRKIKITVGVSRRNISSIKRTSN